MLTASVILEVGCGVGNTIFPLLQINRTSYVYACDFAPTAINIVHQHPLYKSSNRVTAFVADLINDDMINNVPNGIVDACTMIFVLSAISPEAMPAAVANVKQTLRRYRCSSGNVSDNSSGGGQILFRDYAVGDLAQERLQREYKQQRIGEGFYMRGDGTRAYYFTESFVLELFEQQGFRCDSLVVKDIVKMNRSTGVAMRRKFLHGVFTLAEGYDDDGGGISGGDSGENGIEKPSWTPFKGSFEDRLKQSSTIVWEYREGEVNIGEEKDCRKAVDIGDTVSTHLEKYISQYNSYNSASKVLAKIILRCPDLFHDINVVQVRCGGSNCGFPGLPLFATARWCRRALAVDKRRDAIEIFRKYALRNGWQFSYEKLRVAIEPPASVEESMNNGAGENWAAAAFQGPIHGVLACIESQDSLMIVQEVLFSASRVLMKGQEGFLLLAGPREILSFEDGKGEEMGVMAAQIGFKCEACEYLTELLKAIEGINLGENSVMLYRSI